MNAVVSSRTPEGFPSRCPVCGAATNLEYSDPTGDAPCPRCGCLLWRSSLILERMREVLGVSAEKLSADTPLRELCNDSLDTVEMVMAFEEDFDLNIPDDVAERIQTVGDAIRYLESRLKEKKEPPNELS